MIVPGEAERRLAGVALTVGVVVVVAAAAADLAEALLLRFGKSRVQDSQQAVQTPSWQRFRWRLAENCSKQRMSYIE